MNWNSVIFTEETGSVLKKYKSEYCNISRAKKVIRVVKNPPKIHLWNCFSSKGFDALYFFTGILNSEKMIQVYKKSLLSSGRKLDFDDTSNRVLQEDNDPKHLSNACINWKVRGNAQRFAL